MIAAGLRDVCRPALLALQRGDSKRRLLALEGAHPVASKTLFEVLLPVAPPQPGT